jgi:hypothetical protein
VTGLAVPEPSWAWLWTAAISQLVLLMCPRGQYTSPVNDGCQLHDEFAENICVPNGPR